jgi:cation transport ATPase
MKDESLLEEIGENLLEETGDNLLEESEEMERRTQELEAERKKAVEARKQAEKRAEEQRKRAEVERGEREKRKKEAERSLSKEELEKRRRKQKQNLTIFFAYVVVLVHLSFLLWISLDFSGATKSVFFWMGIVISGFLAYGVAARADDDYNDDKPFMLFIGGWCLFILYVIVKGLVYLAS